MPPSFVLLHGPDDFAAVEALDALKADLGDPGLVALNTSVLDGRVVTLGDLREACDALPFLAPRRLVVVEGLLTHLVSKEAPDDQAPGEPARPAAGAARELQADLLDYLPRLPESTLLVFFEKREIPKRNPVLLAAAQAGWAQVKYFDVPRGEALVRWIRARAKSSGGELTRDAAAALGEAEDDPRALDHEIDKLLAYVARARPVEVDDVQALTPSAAEANIFELVDSIGQRRGPIAQRELHRMLAVADTGYVFTMVVRQYRLLLLTKELLAGGASEAEVAHTLSLKPYPAGKLCAQARNYTLPGLEHIYHRLLDYDAQIKTGQVEPSTALDMLVAALTT